LMRASSGNGNIIADIVFRVSGYSVESNAVLGDRFSFHTKRTHWATAATTNSVVAACGASVLVSRLPFKFHGVDVMILRNLLLHPSCRFTTRSFITSFNSKGSFGYISRSSVAWVELWRVLRSAVKLWQRVNSDLDLFEKSNLGCDCLSVYTRTRTHYQATDTILLQKTSAWQFLSCYAAENVRAASV